MACQSQRPRAEIPIGHEEFSLLMPCRRDSVAASSHRQVHQVGPLGWSIIASRECEDSSNGSSLAHVLVAVVDPLERIGPGDHSVEVEVTIAIEPQKPWNVLFRCR